MELRQYFVVIWRWLWLIVLGTILAGGTGYVVSKNTAPVYRASTTLLISQARNPVLTDYTSVVAGQTLAKTYAELLNKRPILEEVMRRLGLQGKLPASISIRPVQDTQLLQLSVESHDPHLAMDIATSLPQVFIEENESMQTSRYASSKENLAKQLTSMEKDIGTTQQAITTLRGSASAADQAELARLQSTLTQYQSSYASLLKSYEDIRLAEAQSMDNLVVVEPPELPRFPVRPNTLSNTLLAAVVGCMLAVGVAFLVEYLDDTIKTSEDVSQTLELSTLGAVTRMNISVGEEGLVAALQPRSPVAEAYRALRTNIQFSTVDRPLKTLLVTSTSPREGKSTTVANLAVVMAQAGLSVIVVDSDLRRPDLHKFFGLANSQGLTNALLESTATSDGYLQATAVEKLQVLTSGPLPPNPSELLGSQRMKGLIEQLKGQADVLIFDSPPLLAVTDAAVLANEVDAVLLVVEAGATRRGAVLQARETMTKVGANLLGVALNKLSAKGAGGYYYYYYYSSEGEGRERRRRKRPRGTAAGVVGTIQRWMANWPSGGRSG